MNDDIDIALAAKSLIFIDPFYGYFSLGVQKEFSDIVPTAGAGFININPVIYFNEKFWNNLSGDHRIGLLMHELQHIIEFHIINRDSYADKELYNVAADISINQRIPAKNLPPNGVYLNSFPELNLPPHLSADEYYTLLEKSQQNSPKLQSLLSAMKDGKQTVCSHETWDGDGDDDGNGDADGGSKSGVGRSEAVKELIKRQVEHQLKEVFEEYMGKDPGKIPGHLRDFIRNLYNKVKPVTDWKRVVRAFKSFCDKQEIKFTRQRINKRFPDNDAIFLKRVRKLLVGIDVSGSISPDILNKFFDQIDHIQRTGVEIDIAEWDVTVHRTYKYNKKSFNANFQMGGGGGTSAEDMIRYFNASRYHNGLICFTDGFIGGRWQNRSKPVLWVVTKDGTLNFDYIGKKIQMNS